MTTRGWWTLGLAAIAIVTGVGYFLQRQESAVLHAEIAILKDQRHELTVLKKEHERLSATQPPAPEVERLRNDRAALVRMRSEIEELKARAEKMAQGQKR